MSENLETGEVPTGNVIVIVAKTALFSAGQLHITAGAKYALQKANTSFFSLLDRHLKGDWGDLDRGDKKMNDAAVKSGDDRIFSAYILAATGETIWIITEADRSVTTALLPDEY